MIYFAITFVAIIFFVMIIPFIFSSIKNNQDKRKVFLNIVIFLLIVTVVLILLSGFTGVISCIDFFSIFVTAAIASLTIYCDWRKISPNSMVIVILAILMVISLVLIIIYKEISDWPSQLFGFLLTDISLIYFLTVTDNKNK